MAHALEIMTPERLRGNFGVAALLAPEVFVPARERTGRTFGLAAADTYESPALYGCSPTTGMPAVATSGMWGLGLPFNYLVAPAGLELVSTASADAAAGTGAQSILVVYLDSLFNVKTELIVPTGTTPVATVNTDYFRILWMEVMAAGSGGINNGFISLRAIGGGPSTTYEYMLRARGITSSCKFTVPIGKALLVTDWLVSQSAVFAPAECRLRAGWNRNAKTKGTVMKILTTLKGEVWPMPSRFLGPTAFPAGTDIDVTIRNPNAFVIMCSAQIHGTLVDA